MWGLLILGVCLVGPTVQIYFWAESKISHLNNKLNRRFASKMPLSDFDFSRLSTTERIERFRFRDQMSSWPSYTQDEIIEIKLRIREESEDD